jgi:PhnB protein
MNGVLAMSDPPMTDTVENLILDLVEWVGSRERTYHETMSAWRTTCPRFPVWEDATDLGLIETAFVDGRSLVRVTPTGLARLKEKRPHCFKQLQRLPVNNPSDRSHFTPSGWHTLTPRIVAHEAERLVEFVKQVFGAAGEYRADMPAVLNIGDSIVMISDAGIRDAAPAFLYVYVEDTDRTYRRALAAGARSLEEPLDLPYGDRRAMVEDEWGNIWQIATHRASA